MFQIEKMIIFEDSEILVCRKMAGIAVQNARFGVMDMESALKNYLAAKNPGQMPYLGIVHRLDQPVEGLLVFAKTKRAAAELSRQMTAGMMGKRYLAVTSGQPPHKQGVLENYLKKDGKTNTSSVVAVNTPEAKKARLSYQVLQEIGEETFSSGKKTLIYIQLETGRHHQIRVQMKEAGMPLVGDRKYNSDEKTFLSLGLCSYQLTFIHPKTKKQMEFEIFPEGDAFVGFEKNLKKL